MILLLIFVGLFLGGIHRKCHRKRSACPIGILAFLNQVMGETLVTGMSWLVDVLCHFIMGIYIMEFEIELN